MKLRRILVLAATLCVLIVTASAQQPIDKALLQSVLQLEEQWQQALLTSDVAVLERLYGEDLTYVHSNGRADNKESYIASIRSGATKYQSIARDEIKVRVFANTAIVTCHWKVQTLSNGTVGNTDGRYIHVYVKVKGRWQMVAHQSTKIV